MLSIGGIIFGIIVGYLTWYAIRLGEPGIIINLKTVAAFIGVVGGAAITALIPPNTELFAAYCVGLGIGFFFTPIQRYILEYTLSHKIQTKDDLIKQEKSDIDAKWAFIENYIRAKISNPLFDEFGLHVSLMKEIDYTLESKIYILKRFAQEHIDEGFEIDDTVTKWGDKFPTHDIEYTHLQKNVFFIPQIKGQKKNKSSNS